MNVLEFTSHPLVIEIAGTALPPRLAAGLLEVCVFQTLSLPSLAEISFQGAGLDADELIGIFSHGTVLRLAAGAGSKELFQGQISATVFEAGAGRPPVFRLRAFDPLQTLRQRGTVRAFVDINLMDLAGEVTADLGLNVSGEAGPVWTRLIQHHQSDFSLLESAAWQMGLFFAVHAGELRFVSLEGDGPSLPLKPGGNLRDLRVESNSARAANSVSVSAWNPHQVRPFEAAAADPCSVPDAPRVPVVETKQSLFARTMPGDDHAGALAGGELNQRRAASFSLWAVAEGDPDLRPGRRVALEGAGRSFSGTFAITKACHRFDAAQGFSTEIFSAPPEPPSAPCVPSTLTLPGLVVRVNDPENLGRIRVSLPTIANVETDWMPVVLPGAGKNKGMIALPDVGDRVLVLCPDGDPSFGVVLGGLPAADHHPDSGVGKGGIVRYTFGTAGGQSLTLDAEKKSLQLDNKHGGKLTINPGGVHLSSQGNLTIDAPGRIITIRGKAIQFEEA